MKKLLLLSTLLLSVTACDKQTKENHSAETVTQNRELQAASLTDYEAAKATLAELFLHAERLKQGEISKEEHDAISYPIGQKFQSQKAVLSEEDRQKLSEYGTARFDEIYPEEDRVSAARE